MLSLIVCSQSPERLAALTHNVEATIGLAHEWIVIDNAIGQHSLFTAYNHGIEESTQPYLCFLHEDLHFHTEDWGPRLIAHLSDPDCGLIGVSGGSVMPRVPASWSAYDTVCSLLQSDRKSKHSDLQVKGDFNKNHFRDVVALDGLFLAAKKALFDRIRFDDLTFTGFHGYDVDICLQAHVLGYHNRVVNDILIEHFSKGVPSRQWVENSLQLHEKWKNSLPLFVTYPGDKALEACEKKYLLSVYMKRMIRASYKTDEIQAQLLRSLQHISATRQPFFRWYVRWLIYWQRFLKRPLTLIPLFR